MHSSLVHEHEFAPPGDAARHYAERLAMQTDLFDVFADRQSGCGAFVFCDVCSADAFQSCHATGSISTPHRQIDEAFPERFPADTCFVVYCWGPACNGAHKAALRLARLGFKVKEMIGGFEDWVREGLRIKGDHTGQPDKESTQPGSNGSSAGSANSASRGRPGNENSQRPEWTRPEQPSPDSSRLRAKPTAPKKRSDVHDGGPQ